MHPAAMEPLLLTPPPADLAELALTLEREAAALGAMVPPDVVRELGDVLRIANSYYSNRIEGNDTTPAGVMAAMRHEFAADPVRRSLQQLALAHVEVERAAEGWLARGEAPHAAHPDLLARLHDAFYRDLPPEERVVRNARTGDARAIEPGRWRTFEVQVALHVAPPAEAVPACLARIADVYDPARLSGLDRALALAAMHHRLLWVHPFADGNGRVVRLATRLHAQALGIGGVALWSPARGLARARERYMAALAEADLPRRNDLDGRGALSREGLVAFTRFFLGACLDQVRYMRGILALDAMSARLADYAARREAGVLPSAGPPLPHGAHAVLHACLASGAIPRGDVPRLIGRGARTASTLVAALLREGLLVTDSPKGPVRLGFPLPALRWLLPELYPEGADAWSPSDP